MWTELLIIVALVLANGIFAGAEIAVISLRKSRLGQLVEEGRAGAQSVLALREDPERFLATVQVGITIVGATAAAFSGASLAARLTPALQRVQGISHAAEDVSLAIVIAFVSYLSLVFGELVPKSIALRSSEAYALLAARPLRALAWLARPLIWILTRSSNLVLRPLGDSTSFTESRLSSDELQQLVEEAAEAGSLDQGASEIASRAIDFGGLTAEQVMIPRNRVSGIPRNASRAEVRRILLEEGHSRMPVYEGTLDNVVGYITARDVLTIAWESDLVVLEDIVRPPLFLPSTAPAIRVLRELQRRHMRLAFIVDEHGGLAGLATFEDLVEELVGELFSEDEKPDEAVRQEADGSAVVRGDLPIREANRLLDLALPEGEAWSTVAGLVVALAGGIPSRGTRVRSGDVLLEVLEASPRAVHEIRIRREATPEGSPPSAAC
ncbi:MAG: hemolysin [Anaeromyxobacter sp. RBG_16_69_14]|nr:MAG: hemolysin [Anaeromyxobacter sp. RBG_16_69_14]